ncbi:hypothetical protein M011DRAFT_64259 [Sporormia fimetaria CBS 119925]|uniref:CAP20-like protein n=1 Tax=Sporormia fimetaria CBS 119925 TaxID=1340428 RepID=A0A6A6VAL7_9PLEO|nr:hypothetical protein M011DRAFT_64259 [Sporormia fimetaria CBS 119925]
MPHAEKDQIDMNGTTETPMTNGEKPASKVLSHLQSYPVVHDSVETFRAHPYGAKSLSVFNTTYERVVAPLHPYLRTPYSYLSPYLSRADELGDSGLSKVETQFPIVKEDTEKLKETVTSLATAPFVLAGQGKEYVWKTWEDEYRKTGGQDGLVKSVKALISTELRMGLDSYNWVSQYLVHRKEQAQKKANEVAK